MEDITLLELWKTQDQKLEKSLQLNMYLIGTLQKDRAKNKLDKLARFKQVALVLGIAWGIFLGVVIYGNGFRNIYFEISVIAIFLFNLYACIAYARQIILIRKLDYSDTIVSTQKKLSGLQVSTINITRVLMLQLPFYTTWFYRHDLVLHDRHFQLVSFTATFIFLLTGIWLYRNITVENMKTKWLRTFMNIGPEYKSITEAKAFLTEIESFSTR